MPRSSAIHKATDSGNIRVVTRWLRDNKSVDPDVLDPEGFTPLFYACREGHSSVAKVLIRAGADVNVKCGADKVTPVHVAAYQGYYRLLRQLVAAGGDVSVRTGDGLAPVHMILRDESPAGVREMVRLGVDLNAQGGLL